MNRICKSILSLCLVLVLALALLPMKAEATDTSPFFVVGYTSSRTSVTKGTSTNVTVTLMRTDAQTSNISLVRNVDDFTGGTEKVDVALDGGKYTATISSLTYRGSGSTLGFTVEYKDSTSATKYQDITVKIAECVPYVEPTYDDSDYTPSACPEPRAVFSVSPLSEPLSAGQKAEVKITVQNLGTVAMKSPILTLTPSSGIMLTGGSSAIVLDDIASKKSATVTVSIQALSEISAQNQGLDCALSFTYYNNSATVTGSSTGKLTIPALTSEEKEEETTTAKPVPRIILTAYDYGGSIEAGKKQAVSFTFKNTSQTMAIENVLLTVAGGGDLTISGSTNTFYFDSIEAGGSRGVSVPFKAASVLSATAQDVRLSFAFEYAEGSARKSGTADLSISVPLFQPDRFTLAEPKVASVGYVGDQNTVTLDYVNKGKSGIYNLEAYLSGDIDTSTPSVRVGNVEAGKSGTIAFAVAPYNEGANPVTITVSYEDGNGETKEQIFEISVEAIAYEEFDGGEWEEPIEEPTTSFPWWIAAAVCVVAAIIVLTVLRKKKKKAKLAAEAALWDDWDDDKSAASAEEKKQ